jgi:hypothetical protein
MDSVRFSVIGLGGGPGRGGGSGAERCGRRASSPAGRHARSGRGSPPSARRCVTEFRVGSVRFSVIGRGEGRGEGVPARIGPVLRRARVPRGGWRRSRSGGPGSPACCQAGREGGGDPDRVGRVLRRAVRSAEEGGGDAGRVGRVLRRAVRSAEEGGGDAGRVGRVLRRAARPVERVGEMPGVWAGFSGVLCDRSRGWGRCRSCGPGSPACCAIGRAGGGVPGRVGRSRGWRRSRSCGPRFPSGVWSVRSPSRLAGGSTGTVTRRYRARRGGRRRVRRRRGRRGGWVGVRARVARRTQWVLVGVGRGRWGWSRSSGRRGCG